METIHARIARLRTAQKKSMVELAEKINVSWQTVQQWENGKTAPQRRRMPKVAEALGVTTTYLVSGDDSEKMNLAASGVTEPRPEYGAATTKNHAFSRKIHDDLNAVAEVVKLMERMDDLGRGMVLQETRTIARERAQAATKRNSA